MSDEVPPVGAIVRIVTEVRNARLYIVIAHTDRGAILGRLSRNDGPGRDWRKGTEFHANKGALRAL